MAAEFYNGKRLSFDGQLCTVRYYGEVRGTKGEWLGVEWDDPSRGKHSGENGGTRYFECVSKNPTAGSFVRPTRKSDYPRTFVEALKAKYASESFEDPSVQIVYVGKQQTSASLAQQNKPIRISGKEVEEVGFDKIRKQLADLHELRIVLLDGLCTSRSIATLKERQPDSIQDAWPEGLTDIKDTCPKIIELDLSRNLFEEWREIASICEQLERLRSLRVDGNRFRDTTLTDAERHRCTSAFSNIKTLRVENTLLPWRDMTYLTNLFPRLTTFVASSNDFSSLSDHCLSTTVTDLSLEDNDFHALSDLQPLTRLPNLQRLILKSNKISEITHHNANYPIFSSTLTEVDLSYNEISTWTFLDSLETVFPGLTSLRISHNPLYQSLQAPDGKALSAEDGYMLTIARLGPLKTLNYSHITQKERLNSESYYLSLIALQLTLSPPSLTPSILATHPRYPYLCAEYGEPTITRSETSVNPNSLAARLIKISFYLGNSSRARLKSQTRNVGPNAEEDDGSNMKGAEVEERWVEEVPMSFTVYALLGIVGKKLVLPPLKLRLFWETGDWVPLVRDEVLEDETWDSASENGQEKEIEEKVKREVEIIPGTRLVGTWVDGPEAVVRVEVR